MKLELTKSHTANTTLTVMVLIAILAKDALITERLFVTTNKFDRLVLTGKFLVFYS